MEGSGSSVRDQGGGLPGRGSLSQGLKKKGGRDPMVKGTLFKVLIIREMLGR